MALVRLFFRNCPLNERFSDKGMINGLTYNLAVVLTMDMWWKGMYNINWFEKISMHNKQSGVYENGFAESLHWQRIGLRASKIINAEMRPHRDDLAYARADGMRHHDTPRLNRVRQRVWTIYNAFSLLVKWLSRLSVYPKKTSKLPVFVFRAGFCKVQSILKEYGRRNK